MLEPKAIAFGDAVIWGRSDEGIHCAPRPLAIHPMENQSGSFPVNDALLWSAIRSFADLTILLNGQGDVLEHHFENAELAKRFSGEFHYQRLREIVPVNLTEWNSGDSLVHVESGRSSCFEFPLSNFEGITFWFEGRLANISSSQLLLSAREITKYKQVEFQARERLHQLTGLRTIDLAIASGLELNLLISHLLEQVTKQLRVDAASLLLLSPETGILNMMSACGFGEHSRRQIQLKLGERFAGQIALERQPVKIPNIGVIPFRDSIPAYICGENFKAYYGFPLLAKGKVLGVIEVFHGSPLAPDADWLEYLEILAGQAAIAIDNALLHRNLQKSNMEMEMAYDSTVAGWSRTLDIRDREGEGHALRVADLTIRLARAMRLSDNELVHLRRGAILHDIGKVGIPDEILLKPGPLNEAEWEVMRRHPEIAVELLSPISYLKPALDIPHRHHEKWDGSGYPDQLAGEQIPFSARIFAVADVFDALTSNRPYRSAWHTHEAVQFIESQSGKYFDPRVVSEFLKLTRIREFAAVEMRS